MKRSGPQPEEPGNKPEISKSEVSVWSRFSEECAADLRARRQHLRNPVESCRPIGLQLMSDDAALTPPWHQADILDLSLGGMCLLLMEDQPLNLTRLMALRLDVRPHPAFGVELKHAELRWFVRSGLIVSLGVGFTEPLASLPELLPCRRAERRPLDLDHTLA